VVFFHLPYVDVAVLVQKNTCVLDTLILPFVQVPVIEPVAEEYFANIAVTLSPLAANAAVATRIPKSNMMYFIVIPL
jgi:hypothetical protein